MSKLPPRVTAFDPAASGNFDDADCTILHVDMDCFFAAVEELDNPAVRGKPVIVGGRSPRSVVCAANYPARHFGVHAAMPSFQAQRLCPHGVFLEPRLDRYREVSKQVMAVLGEVTPTLEAISIDEAFLDVSGARKRMGSPVAIGQWLRGEIRSRLGLAASVGVAATKFVAKLASGYAKPDGLLLIPTAEVQEFLDGLEVGALWGVGKVTREKLLSAGYRTVAQLRTADPRWLQRYLGQKAGQHLWDLAHGIDPRVVTPYVQEKSIGTETTFRTDIHDREHLRRVLLAQAHSCARRLRAAKMQTTTVAIKIRDGKFVTLTRSRKLSHPTDVAREIAAKVTELFAEHPLPAAGIRLVGVRLEGLTQGEGQTLALWEEEDPRVRKTEVVMDEVRARFGADALRPATLVAAPEDPEPKRRE